MASAEKAYRILIVDDNKAFLSATSSSLKSLDDAIVIETARSGNECLRKVKQFGPQLVLLDIGMDGMNGLVTLRFIKSIDTSTLVYFLSGHTEDFLQDAIRMVPADGYFTKTQFAKTLSSVQSLASVLSSGKYKQHK